MALSKDVVIRLLGDASSAQKAIKAAADAAEVSVGAYRAAEREQAKQTKAAEAAASAQAEALQSVGQAAMASGAVIAAGLALAAAAAIEWETAWAGVEKTVDGTPEQMDELEASLRKLATTLPATHEEIAGVAEAAGQLGIAREDILEFTEVAIAMGVSTNLSAEEAATGLAQMMNVMRTSTSDIDRMGSTLVALGNAGASTEADILAMAQRLAGAGELIGASEANVLALASAMADMGIQAELGGGAMSRVMLKIYSAMQEGGEAAEGFARVAGMSASDFAAKWRSSPVEAIDLFVQGLGRVKGEGGNVVQTLADLGISGTQNLQVMLSLAGAGDQLTNALALSNEAWAENSALMNEANKRYETTASAIQIAQNSINDAAIEIGALLLPAISAGADLVADFARGFSELPGWMKGTVVAIGTLAATVGLLGGAIMLATPVVAAFRFQMLNLATTAGASAATQALGRFALFMTGPFGAALGVATLAIGGLIAWLGNSSQASDQARQYQQSLADALRETGGAIDDNIRALAARQAAEASVGESNLLEVTEQLGLSLPRLTDALLGNRDAYDELAAGADAYLQQALALANYNTEDPSFAAAAARVAAYKEALKDSANAMGGAVAENERLAAAQEQAGGSAEKTKTSMDSLAGATGDVAGNAEDAASAAERLAEVLDALNGPTLDMREATRGYQDAIDKARESLKEHGRTLDENTDAGRANAEALDNIAVKAMEQANAIAANGGSYDAFRNSLNASREALVATAIDMGMTQEQAWALADQILQIPEAHEVDIEIPTYGQVTAQLIDVMNRIRGIPPQTWTNVGVISGPAIQQLEAVGVKTRTLPDGTVEVYADTSAAWAKISAITAARHIATIFTNVVGNKAAGGAIGRAGGGSVYGPGGPTDDLIPATGPAGSRYQLSNGEHILDARDVALMGGQGGVYAFREALNAGRLQVARGLAGGGALDSPAIAQTTAARGSSYSTTYNQQRNKTINVRVVNQGPPMSERDLMERVRDQEWLSGG